MMRGLLRDHGGVFILLLMCAVLSAITIEEHHPTGAGAGRALARTLLEDIEQPRVFVAADDLPEHSAFLDALTDELEAAGGEVLARVQGDPRAVRSALEASLVNAPPDALLALRTSDAWSLLERAPERYPALATTRVLAPRPYRWSTFLTRDNLLNVAEAFLAAR